MALEASTVAKIAKLITLGKEHTQKAAECYAEIDELLGGGAGIAAKLKQFEATFDRLWCERYAKGQTGRYVWNFIRDRANTKRLIRSLGLEELERRAGAYFGSGDSFYLQNRHPFTLFVSSINSLAAPAAAQDFSLEVPAPADCRHVPACRSDQEHTRRRRQEREA